MILNKNLTIVIILYDSSELIFDCLQKLNNFEIIIVDNGKNNFVLERLKQYKNIKKIISKNKNLGFGNGVNYAFSFIKTDFFLVLNPDIIIDENSIKELFKISAEDRNCAISAPLILTDKDGFGVLPEKWKKFTNDSIKEGGAFSLENFIPSGNICVDVAKGCALLINSKHFENVGMFSKEYFLFWEEIDLCRKFLKKKLSIIVCTAATAEHKEGSSVKNNIRKFAIRTFYTEKSPLYYFKVKRYSLNIYIKILKYLFRTGTYLLVFNFKSSLKNFIKFSATISYIVFR
jgi:N-acetylglucosaminyl-diphospho-decaprenol L-rhamnosyltransferase